VPGLKEEIVSSEAELLDVVARADLRRAYASTILNERSSRSHVIYR
jgi:hypothetical protein